MSSSYSNSIKEERHDEAEIRELAAKMFEANKTKMASAAARQQQQQQQQQQSQPSNQVANNILGFFLKKNDGKNNKTGVQTSSSTTQTDTPRATDEESVRGRFGWVQLGKCLIPYIFRGSEKYCAVRMVEMKLLNKYLNYLHQDIYSCTCIRSYYITEAESRLLNEINGRHCDNQFGREMFTTRDLIVRLSDANEFYNFLDVCYSKLIQGSCNPKDRCGFIRINKESVVPYTVKDDNKYVPLFYFEGETDNLKLKADKLEGWDLSYLKFCCKVQGIRNELFAHDSCSVISLNAIKSYFPPGTGFEDYWPSKVVDAQLLLNGKNPLQNGQWTKQPATPPAPPPASVPVPQAVNKCPQKTNQACSPSVQAMYSNYSGLVGGQPGFQNMATTQANAQMTRMAQSPARAAYAGPAPASPRPAQRHQYYTPHTMAQAPPPPLIRTAVPPTTGYLNTTPVEFDSSYEETVKVELATENVEKEVGAENVEKEVGTENVEKEVGAENVEKEIAWFDEDTDDMHFEEECAKRRAGCITTSEPVAETSQIKEKEKIVKRKKRKVLDERRKSRSGTTSQYKKKKPDNIPKEQDKVSNNPPKNQKKAPKKKANKTDEFKVRGKVEKATQNTRRRSTRLQKLYKFASMVPVITKLKL